MDTNKKLMKELKEVKESFDSTRSGKEIKELKKQVKELKEYRTMVQDMLLKAENEAEKYKQLYNDSLLTATDENMDLKKQLSQLERKESTVSKDKYESLQTALEEMRKDNIKVRKELETMQKMYYNASDKVKDQIEKDSIISTLKEQLELYQNKIDTGSKSGRKRKSSIADDDIIRMNEEGKSLRVINKETGLSINTIRGILGSVSK